MQIKYFFSCYVGKEIEKACTYKTSRIYSIAAPWRPVCNRQQGLFLNFSTTKQPSKVTPPAQEFADCAAPQLKAALVNLNSSYFAPFITCFNIKIVHHVATSYVPNSA
jgi:hypothetical protein